MQLPYEQFKKQIDHAFSQFKTHYREYGATLEYKPQPVHTVYGGAQLWQFDRIPKIGQAALQHLQDYCPDSEALASALHLEGSKEFTKKIYERVKDKLQKNPVEDFRIDFEDGYGPRPDKEEDEQAVFAAEETYKGNKEHTLPPFLGIRIKTLNEEYCVRAIRTLDLFVTTLLKCTKGTLPANFVITVPKVMMPEQVTAVCEALLMIEKEHGLPSQSIPIEIMIETPQAILNAEGRSNLPALIKAAQNRCRGIHFGTYDYTALCQIVAEHQSMLNPVCEFAKHLMQVCSAQTGIWLSDGATNIMPVPLYRGEKLSSKEKADNLRAVHSGLKLSFDHIQNSLKTGYYQGWDLHPGQLVSRYASVYHFFLSGFDSAAKRLKNFIEQSAKATLVGDVFDDAATGQGLLNYFLRALSCQAITEDEALQTGLTVSELRLRSFAKIIKSRNARTS